MGRTGTAMTWTGRVNLRNARYARDPLPLDEACPCPACSRFSRAYLRHLVNQQELLGARLVTLHNLRFVLDLTASARAAVEHGTLAHFKRETLERLARNSEEAPCRQ
jgi:queuine tRNA-ribosyltransferase